MILVKAPGGYFMPASDEDIEKAKRFKVGAGIRADIAQIRNYRFHKKFFAMLNLGFDAWEPPEAEFRGMPVQKSFERFRKDCIIAAGFFDPVANIKGEVRPEAHSISFANMDDEAFERVYSAVANVILTRILTRYTRDDLDNIVNEMVGFF